MKRTLINLLVCVNALLLLQCSSTSNNTSDGVIYASGPAFEMLGFLLKTPYIERYINRYGKEYVVIDENNYFKCKRDCVVKLEDYTLYFSPDAEKDLRIYVSGNKLSKNKYLLRFKTVDKRNMSYYFNAIIVKEKDGFVLRRIINYEI